MSSTDKLFKLASRFARKLSLGQGTAPDTSQVMEAPDFFFGVGRNLQSFQDALGQLSVSGDKAMGDKSLAALMANFFNKTQQNVNVTISVDVKPGVGAKWIAQITPPAFVPSALAELGKQYQILSGKSWSQGEAAASAAAKAAKTIEGPGNKLIVDKGL